MTTLAKAARTALEKRADAKVKASYEKYFLGVVTFHGVRGPAVKALLKELAPHWKGRDVDELAKEALAMTRAKFFEEKQLGLFILGKVQKRLADSFVDDVGKVFDDVVNDWATCDGFCSQVLREMIRRDSTRPKVKAWAKSKNLWKQRASAVAFVNEAKTGKYDDDVIEVCERIVKNPERFVQLGCGWVLRELSLTDRPRVLKFIDDNAEHMSREGLRYATEKLPKNVRDDVHAKHAKKSGRGRAR